MMDHYQDSPSIIDYQNQTLWQLQANPAANLQKILKNQNNSNTSYARSIEFKKISFALLARRSSAPNVVP